MLDQPTSQVSGAFWRLAIYIYIYMVRLNREIPTPWNGRYEEILKSVEVDGDGQYSDHPWMYAREGRDPAICLPLGSGGNRVTTGFMGLSL